MNNFEHARGAGWSKPLSRAGMMTFARTQLGVGAGPFTVDGHTPSPRIVALGGIDHEMAAAKEGFDLRVHDGASKLVLHIRLAPVPVYQDMFRDVRNLVMLRIDAGVDAMGSGPVYPFGKARILQVGVPSHTSQFGNTLSVYELLEGPGEGKRVFFGEHYNIHRHFAKGDVVTSSTVLWSMNGGVEVGWSDGVGSIAWDSGSYSEGQLSVYGEDMSKFIVMTGGSSGQRLGRSTVGHLPPGWPTW